MTTGKGDAASNFVDAVLAAQVPRTLNIHDGDQKENTSIGAEWTAEFGQSLGKQVRRSWKPQTDVPVCPFAPRRFTACPYGFAASSLPNSHPKVRNWDAEFARAEAQFLPEKEQTSVAECGEENLRDAARKILNESDRADENLQQSQFFEYLRDLSGETDQTPDMAFAQWKRGYRENIEHIVEDYSWDAVEKNWEKYEANGFGYENFYSSFFENYKFQETSHAAEAHGSTVEGDFLGMLLQVERNVRSDPRDSHSWRKLALLNSLLDRSDRAIEAFVQLEKIGCIERDDLVHLSRELLLENCRPDALEALDKFAESNLGRISEWPSLQSYAASVLHAMQSKDRESPMDATCMALLSKLVGEWDGDLVFGTINNDPRDLNLSAVILSETGRKDEAVTLLTGLLKERPQFQRARYNLAYNLMEQGKLNEAALNTIALLKLSPQDVYWTLLDMIYERMDNEDLIDLSYKRDLKGISSLISF